MNKKKKKSVLVAPDAQRARTQQSEKANEFCLPFCSPSTPLKVSLVSLEGMLAETVVVEEAIFLAFDDA